MPAWNTNLHSNRVSRRRVLRGGLYAGAGLAGAALIGCGGASGTPPDAGVTPVANQSTPSSGGGNGTPSGNGGNGGEARPGIPVVEGAPTHGGTFTYADDEIYVQHDQHTAVSNSEWAVMGERAMELDEWTGELRANIVESWEIPDETHFILHVRPGVKIHNRPPWDGREFDAEDLEFNLNRIAGNTAEAEGLAVGNFQRATTMEGMESLEVVDSHTLRVNMAQPSSTFLNGVTEIRNQLMPKGIVEVGFEDPMKFAGISPFMITEWTPGVRQTFTAQEGYYREGEPYFDEVVLTVLPDRAAMLASFISEQTSVFTRPTVQDKQAVMGARPDALLYSYMGVNYQFMMMNFNHAAFKDFRVRQALNLVANREEIGNGYHGEGWGYLAAIHPAFPEAWQVDKVTSTPGWNPDTKQADIEEAVKLMAAAGHEGGAGIAFNLMNKPKPDNRENSIRYQAQLREAFPEIGVELVAPETAVFDQAQSGSTFEAISNDSTMQPDAGLESYARFHTDGSRNYGQFTNADADGLLEQILSELDFEARKQLLDEFQTKWVNEWLPMVTYYATPVNHFVQPNIGGFDQVMGPWDSGRGVTHKLGRLYYV